MESTTVLYVQFKDCSKKVEYNLKWDENTKKLELNETSKFLSLQLSFCNRQSKHIPKYVHSTRYIKQGMQITTTVKKLWNNSHSQLPQLNSPPVNPEIKSSSKTSSNIPQILRPESERPSKVSNVISLGYYALFQFNYYRREFTPYCLLH